MFTIFVYSLVAGIAFSFVGFLVGEHAIWRDFAIAVAGLGGVISLLLAFDDVIEWHKKHDAPNRILHELDPNTLYLVRSKIYLEGSLTMEVFDFMKKERRIAFLRSSYPPEGFREEKHGNVNTNTMRTFLVPDEKQLVVGTKEEVIFAPSV